MTSLSRGVRSTTVLQPLPKVCQLLTSILVSFSQPVTWVILDFHRGLSRPDSHRMQDLQPADGQRLRRRAQPSLRQCRPLRPERPSTRGQPRPYQVNFSSSFFSSSLFIVPGLLPRKKSYYGKVVLTLDRY